MESTNNKSNAFAAVAGAVVGAGAVLAGAVALADKKNMSKVNSFLDKTKKVVNNTKREVKNL